MDGIQLLAALRESTRQTPALMISGDPTVGDAIQTGATAFLAKPFKMSRLLDEARKVMTAPS
jgi:DNA-binding NtrC family response regulator